jgi:hypothetical protein
MKKEDTLHNMFGLLIGTNVLDFSKKITFRLFLYISHFQFIQSQAI